MLFKNAISKNNLSNTSIENTSIVVPLYLIFKSSMICSLIVTEKNYHLDYIRNVKRFISVTRS